MIRINLLPHREETKRLRKNVFFAAIFLSILLGVMFAVFGYVYFQYLISDQNNANKFVRMENAKLKEKIKEVDSIEREIAALVARQKAVEDLQSERNLPVELMNQIVGEVPNGVYFTLLKKTGRQVALSGAAQSNQTVSDLLNAISYEMPWDSKPQLIETKANNFNFGSGRSGRIYDFSMNFMMNDHQDKKSQ